MRTLTLPLVSRLFTAPLVERTINLPAHTCLQLDVASGTQLICVAGSLLVQPAPQWIATTLLTPSMPLDEGAHCELAQAGSTTLRAGRHGARVQLLEPASALSRIIAIARSSACALQALGSRGKIRPGGVRTLPQ